ncbi:SDR family oxidoreductase [Ruegeria sp. 2205SS24-7]|uniref:SDR family oxidoreductase n=1 Tax=Ruegeria discodermiae TaxID=3064389 RepID=UPI0027405665|nr:SDR family oxidoreductase [Ruegeria sp. 2205SS24-7]MDP5215887.1 SDR family oxidoreductase [Ruegeria sp. 2205SS24-7]
MSKVILITGASTGLGVSLAVQAAQAGHKVYASMRNLDKRAGLDAAVAAAGVSVECLQLDVQDDASVAAAMAQVIASEGRIDVLINNAGAGYVRSTEQAEMADVHWVVDVNFTGVLRCTKAALPHMRAARCGHIINIGSVGGLVGQPFNEIYCAAKFAVEGYTEALACYVTPHFGINFTVVEPGGIQTEFANSVLKQVSETGGMLEDEYLPILQSYISGSQARGDTAYQSADEVAEVVIRCMEAETPPIRARTSDWAEDLCRLKTEADPDGRKLQAKVMRDFLGL